MKNNNIPNRKKIPTNRKLGDLNIIKPEHSILKNGLDLYFIESGLENVTRLDIIVGAGSMFQQKSLCSSFTSNMLKEGTANLSSQQIAEELDFNGAYLNTSTSKDKAVITLFSLSKHLSKLLPMLKSLVTDASFPENEFKVQRDREKQEFLINSEKAKIIANRSFNELIFGETTAYGRVTTLDDFDKISNSDLQKFHKNFYQPKNSYLIVSGKPNNESKKLINKLFGEEWQNNNFEVQLPTNISTKQFSQEKTIKREQFLQSAIRLGKNVINKFDKDYSKLLFTNTILGGYFGSRLMSNLREDKGMTYGVSSFISSFLHGSYFAIATEVNIKQTKEALKEIEKEIRILQNEKIDSGELNLVKNYIYGNFIKNFDGPFALAEMFMAVNNFGLSFDYYQESLKKMMAISAEDVLETAQKQFDLNEISTLVVGNRE